MTCPHCRSTNTVHDPTMSAFHGEEMHLCRACGRSFTTGSESAPRPEPITPIRPPVRRPASHQRGSR